MIKAYDSDLTIEQWKFLEPLIPAAKTGERGAKILCWKARRRGASTSRLIRIWANAGYQGQAFMQWVMDRFRYVLEVVKHSDDVAGFKVVRKRWIVERTFGWLLWSRRLNKDYEVLPRTAEAFVYVAMSRLMICRLADAT